MQALRIQFIIYVVGVQEALQFRGKQNCSFFDVSMNLLTFSYGVFVIGILTCQKIFCLWLNILHVILYQKYHMKFLRHIILAFLKLS